MSVAEYFAHKGLKEADRVEVTYEDGTKVAVTGKVALMWWRMAHILWKDLEDLRHDDVYKFRPVDADGNVEPPTLPEMIELHDWSTGICSFPGHMRSISPTYKEIVALGDKALPAILEYLRDKGGGMNIVLLLQDITQTSPYKPLVGPHFVGYKVDDCIKSWLQWGKKNKHIK